MSITINFSENELAGPGESWSEIPKNYQNNLIVLAKTILQPARTQINSAIDITSGFRSMKHNDWVRGATTSQHMFGKAVDIKTDKFTGLEFFEFIIKNYGYLLGGIGLYHNENIKGKFIHIDIRDKPAKNIITSWYYNSKGIYISPTPLMQSIANKYNIKLIG